MAKRDPRGAQHYKEMEIEPFDVMKQMGILEAYAKGAAIKYLMRSVYQQDPEEAISDLEKAVHCADVAKGEAEQDLQND